jgi:glycosyltransferase involved in cell wall biosynthesis
MVKVTYVLSLIFKSLEYEWIVRYIDRSRVDLSFILLNPEACELQQWLQNENVKTYHVPFYGKLSYPRCLFRTIQILKKEKPDFVNCNLLDANMIGLTAAYFAGVRNRVYTRHHSTFHHVYFKKGRYYDYYANFLSTQIVAVSSLVKRILIEKEGVPEGKIRLIPHGFGIPDFENVTEERINKLRGKYSIFGRSPVVGVISRYIEWKGVQYIIPAFEEVLKQYPNAVLLIANARQGTYTKEILSRLSKLPLESYREIEFESDVLAFYKLLDVFVHTPIDDHSEAFGRIYPESLAAGIPLVCTISGIAHDIIVNGVNALVVPHKNSPAITAAILEILKNRQLSSNLSNNAKETALRTLSMEKQKALLEHLYLSQYAQP